MHTCQAWQLCSLAAFLFLHWWATVFWPHVITLSPISWWLFRPLVWSIIEEARMVIWHISGRGSTYPGRCSNSGNPRSMQTTYQVDHSACTFSLQSSSGGPHPGGMGGSLHVRTQLPDNDVDSLREHRHVDSASRGDLPRPDTGWNLPVRPLLLPYSICCWISYFLCQRASNSRNWESIKLDKSM